MFVHGVKADFRTNGFPSLFKDGLLKEFPQDIYPNSIRSFRYYQDVGSYNGTTNICPPDGRLPEPIVPREGIPVPIVASTAQVCDSQSDLGTNAVLLYEDMVTFLNETGHQRKITLVCNSMGCSIVRGFLAYAMEMHDRDPVNPSATDLVDSVIFLEGIQAGSLLDLYALGGLGLPPPLNQLYGLALQYSPFHYDLSRPAVQDLRPKSDYLTWARQEHPAGNQALPYTPPLDYFNVYGDIRLVGQTCFVTCISTSADELGDIAILPGSPSPYGTSWEGGARFLYNNTETPDNWEWGMRHDFPYVASSPLGPLQGLPSQFSAVQQAYNAPEQHENLGAGIATIQVEDCQTKQPISAVDQFLKVLRGRLYNQHAMYACSP
jgi:hypothetical protein